MTRPQHRNLRRNGFKFSNHTKAEKFVKDGENMILAGRFDDALPFYLNARSALAEAHDERSPALRKVVERCIVWLEGKLGREEMAPATLRTGAALARTEPQPSDLEAVFRMTERVADAEVIRDVDEALLKKAGA